ncbi:MAG: FHA domain-containing protein [Planctomycetota bacterium]
MQLRVTLQIDLADAAGPRRSLRPFQTLTVGRDGSSDWEYPADQMLSSRHFQLSTDAAVCRLKDLESTNGTLLNGQPVSQGVLADGDLIEAGNTKFKCRIDGGRPPQTREVEAAKPTSSKINASASATSSSGFVAPLAVSPEATKASADTLSMSQSKAGTYVMGGPLAPASASGWIATLETLYQPVLVVDSQAIDEAVREQLPEDSFVYSFLPMPQRRFASPIALMDDQWIPRGPLVDELFGSNQMLVVLCPKDEPIPVKTIMASAGLFTRPEIMRPQLTETTTDVVAALMPGLAGVFAEADQPEAWTLIMTDDPSKEFEQLGWSIEREPSATDSSPTSEG